MPQRKSPCGRDSQQRELLPIHTAFPFNSPRGETIAGTKIGFSRREANESGGIFVRRVRKSLKKPFRPRPTVFGRPPSIFGTHFAITSINCGTATAVRFLHLFKFGLVVLGGRPPRAAGNREIPCCFCIRMPGAPFLRAQGTKKPPGVPIGSLQRSGCRFHGAAMRSGTKTVRRTTRENSKIQPTHHGKT